jgi:hypothetical protein
MHVDPAGQTLPQIPQFPSSVARSTHTPPQQAKPAAQQTAWQQIRLCPHVVSSAIGAFTHPVLKLAPVVPGAQVSSVQGLLSSHNVSSGVFMQPVV